MKNIFLVAVMMLGLLACGKSPEKGPDFKAWSGPKPGASDTADVRLLFACRKTSANDTLHHYYYVTVDTRSKEIVSEDTVRYTKASLETYEVTLESHGSNTKTGNKISGPLTVKKSVVSTGAEAADIPVKLYQMKQDDVEVWSVAHLFGGFYSQMQNESQDLSEGDPLECQTHP